MRPSLSRRNTAVVFALLPMLNGCAHPGGTQTHITADTLHALIESGKAPTIVDVRSRWEFDRGHVPHAKHMPFWSIYWHSDTIGAHPDQPVVVYCEHGPRAGIARFALHQAGFTRVLYLEGHMSGWRDAGLPIELAHP